MRRKGVSEFEISKRTNHANAAFPDALVKGYRPLIENLVLPDPKGCHVLAAAIKVEATVIVTNNLKDFPNNYLKKFAITAKSPDDFAAEIIDKNLWKSLKAFKKLVSNRKNPNLNEQEVLNILRKRGLKTSADCLYSFLKE